MITEEQIELLAERLIDRINKANEYFLKNIGESIYKVGKLKPSEAHQLVQILKYGGKYDEIVKKISDYTNMNIIDIDKIFDEYAKKDQRFYERFYEYRNIPFIPYEENKALQMQTQALKNIAMNEAYNFTRSNVLGYSIADENGIVRFTGLRETYNQMLDEALLNVGQGKETFDSAMSGIMKQLGTSGLKTINYESGRSIRLDSAVRMHLKGRLRELHNENQKIIGGEFGSDGIEISVHMNPAPDHEEVQGRQFSNEEYDKLSEGLEAHDIKGRVYTLDHDGNGSYRPISEMNCYHYIFSIVLGVSEPEYNDTELKIIRDNNNQGFMLDGKQYTNYQGTQMQRSLERKIREQKDIQILAKESNNTELIGQTQKNIRVLSGKYNELNKASGLKSRTERMRIATRNNQREIDYARENNSIWHSTENLEEIVNSNKIIAPSLAVGKELNGEVRYGSQFIEFEPEILENVDRTTFTYKGDGGNIYTRQGEQYKNLMTMLKSKPAVYNELKFNKDLESLKYIKKVYVRQDEPKSVLKLLEKNGIEYQIYHDYRERIFKKKR